MMKLPPTVLIQETNFHNSWARAVRYVIRDGVLLVIGGVEEPKSVRDICATIELTGNAIQQIEDRELHPLFPFRHIDQYCEEFTREYLSQYIKKQGHERFSYLYFERLAHQYYFPLLHYIDQVEEMCGGLAGQIDTGSNSNRNQSITWNIGSDLNSTSPPCLQRIWIRYLGDQSVEVHLTWRSRDLFTAWQANVIALVDMLNREVVHPNSCKIVKVVDYSDSLHIHESDMVAAKNVTLVPISPMTKHL